MSLSDVGKLCLFSGLSGVITLDGKPVANATVKRIVGKAHTQGKKTDETTTDENGHFSMPAVFDRSIIGKFLPMEFSVPQEIFVYHESKEYDIWSGVKRKPEENAESRGKPLKVQCRLEAERKSIEVNGGVIFTRCTWDVEPDTPFVFDGPDETED